MTRTLVVFLVACGGGQSPDVGAVCDLGASQNEIVVQTPFSQCKSQVCLHITTSTPDLCTIECATDDDCLGVSADSPCTAGFTCAPVLSVGPFACENLCVCADRVPATSCP